MKPFKKKIKMLHKKIAQRLIITICLSFMALLFLSCSNHISKRYFGNTLFTRLDSDSTGIKFSNNIHATNKFNLFNYRNFYNGGGVALGDINNDGLIDIYFTANQGENKLYLNEGNFHFKDITKEAGVAGDSFWTTGVTMADVNGDGLLDIYVLNSGDLTGNDRTNELFINQGNLTFKEEAKKFHLDNNGFSTHASFFDYDGDGDLDCYVLNNRFKGTGPKMRQLIHETRNGVDRLGGDELLRNDNGVFRNMSKKAGIHSGAIGFGLGVSVRDINGDYRPDIYISNDFWERDYLYINQADGTFRDELTDRTTKISGSSMGSDMADINNDGMFDILVTDMLPAVNSRTKTMTIFGQFRKGERSKAFHSNFYYQELQNTLQVNNGDGTFREMAFLSGVAATDWSWGDLMFDCNNDGWNDIFVSNGVYRDINDMDAHNFIGNRRNVERLVRRRGRFDVHDLLKKLPSHEIKNFAFINNKDKTFSKKSDSLGFYQPSFSNGAAYGDLDNDGDLDLVINNLNQQAFVYRNNTKKRDHHYLEIIFKGKQKNPFGIGAEVKIFTSHGQQIAENMPSRGFQSSVPPRVHFGLGKITHIDSMLVVWPDLQKQWLQNVKTDQKVIVKQKEATKRIKPNSVDKRKPLIKNVTEEKISGDIRHRENKYIDFNRDPLLPHTLTHEGPTLTRGDINGDGLEDFFVTGALGDEDKVFIQQPSGKFKQIISPDLKYDSIYESTAASLLDIDGDGDLDLMVGNGGNQFDLKENYNKIRIYKNDGNGFFTRAPKLTPNVHISASCIIKDDFNNDEKPDVFIGARNVPKKYGVDPRSYLLEDDGEGRWKDITPDSLKRAGMITDAVWVDYDNDKDDDLVIVGEWMPVTFYKNDSGKLHYDFSLNKSNGLWLTITKKDLDNDGDIDFVLGNWGDNSRFQATPNRSLTMYVGDFRGNNREKFLITNYLPDEDRAYPFPTYKDLLKQLPFLKKKIPDHHTYAKMTYKELFTEDQRERAKKKQVLTLSTSLLIDNNGKYELKKLPLNAQISPVHAIIAEDFDGDSDTDLLLMGNEQELKPEVGRLSGNHGVFLFNDGKLNYKFEPYPETNTIIRGVVRDALPINIGNQKYIIIGRNNDNLLMYEAD